MATGCKLKPCLKKNCAMSGTQCLTATLFTCPCIHVCLLLELNPRLKANIHGSSSSSDEQIGLPCATTRVKFEVHEGSLGSKFKVCLILHVHVNDMPCSQH